MSMCARKWMSGTSRAALRFITKEIGSAATNAFMDAAGSTPQSRSTCLSTTQPSSQVVHPIETSYFHQSHLKGCQDYGHQVVSVMLSYNGTSRCTGHFLFSLWQLVYNCKSDGPFYSERTLYGWGIKDQPNPLAMRDLSKSQCICPSSAENRLGCQSRDRW